MKCPQCGIAFHDDDRWVNWGMGVDREEHTWVTSRVFCPSCDVPIVALRRCRDLDGNRYIVFESVIHPQPAPRMVPQEVPPPYSTDFREACLVLQHSPKASAALSRRILQLALVEKGGAKKGETLYEQVAQVLPTLPSDLEDLDAIRKIGNFAAHPEKDTNTGVVVEVEPGEAEWLLDILELLLDHYFVKPARRAARIQSLQEKLDAAKGKAGAAKAP